MTQDKAQPAVNGYSLNKGCNAVLGHLWASLRARREAVICGVALLERARHCSHLPWRSPLRGLRENTFPKHFSLRSAPCS